MTMPELRALPSDFETAHQSFATRRVPRVLMSRLLAGSMRPAVGELVLARVSQIGQHRSVELVSGRKATLFPDQLVILAYGNRYAPDQFEALVPLDLGPCQMVAGGGVAAREVERHASMSAPTRIVPLGVIADDAGHPLNLRNFALPAREVAAFHAPIYVVCGTSMNAGKTHTVAMLVRGLRASGRRVGAIKVTGTGSGNDLWRMHDAGADPVLDFTDAGWPSTYGTPVADLELVYRRLVSEAVAQGADAVVIEIADGVGQAETAGLLQSFTLRVCCDAVIFAACDALGAAAGVRWLERVGLPVAGVSGLVTAEPAGLEEARSLLEVPVYTADNLASPAIVEGLVAVGARAAA
jgi:hypothetical protein